MGQGTTPLLRLQCHPRSVVRCLRPPNWGRRSGSWQYWRGYSPSSNPNIGGRGIENGDAVMLKLRFMFGCRLEKQQQDGGVRKSPFDETAAIHQHKQQLLRTPSRDYLAVGASNSPKRNDTVNGSGNGSAMWMATASSEQTKVRQYQETGDHPDVTDPPLEYCEVARQRVVGGEPNGDLKRGILGSIIDKVRSKEEGSGGKKSVDCLPFIKDENRKSQPLLDNLLLDCAGGFRSSRDQETQEDSIVQKPYEPPALGKSSRITPVGGVDDTLVTTQHQTINSLEAEAVEVLSVIR